MGPNGQGLNSKLARKRGGQGVDMAAFAASTPSTPQPVNAGQDGHPTPNLSTSPPSQKEQHTLRELALLSGLSGIGGWVDGESNIYQSYCISIVERIRCE